MSDLKAQGTKAFIWDFSGKMAMHGMGFVVGDIPKYAIAGGHPCKPFKQRNIEHCKKLKSEGKFQ